MPDKHGPYRNLRFLLEIDGIAKAGFCRCRPGASSTDVIEYREGNDPPHPRRLAGLNRYEPLRLESGVTDDSIALQEWRRLVKKGKLSDARRTIAIIVLDREGSSGPRWEFKNAWPARYEAPTLAAGDEDIAIEALEIVHEGMQRST